jgi:hypothetical protein
VTELAEKEKVDIRYYDVIYNLIQDIKLAMTGLLEPVFKENFIGRATVKEVFHITKVGAVAGCTVTDGRVERNADVRPGMKRWSLTENRLLWRFLTTLGSADGLRGGIRSRISGHQTRDVLKCIRSKR